MSHVVTPDTVRRPLSDGGFVEIKQELNAGEYFDLITALADRKPFAKLVAYIVGWSLLGADEKPLPYSLAMDEKARRDTIRALKKPIMRELVAMIDKHEAAEELALAKKKETSDDLPASDPISTFAMS